LLHINSRRETAEVDSLLAIIGEGEDISSHLNGGGKDKEKKLLLLKKKKEESSDDKKN
jgi:hypothetical protein